MNINRSVHLLSQKILRNYLYQDRKKFVFLTLNAINELRTKKTKEGIFGKCGDFDQIKEEKRIQGTTELELTSSPSKKLHI